MKTDTMNKKPIMIRFVASLNFQLLDSFADGEANERFTIVSK